MTESATAAPRAITVVAPPQVRNMCKFLCELSPIILHISGPRAVHPARLRLGIEREANEMFASP
jgi:hypothetical protein